MKELEEGEYYRINNTKKILYWNGTLWMKPVKDNRGNIGTWLANLDKQPKNIKNVEKVDFNDLK